MESGAGVRRGGCRGAACEDQAGGDRRRPARGRRPSAALIAAILLLALLPHAGCIAHRDGRTVSETSEPTVGRYKGRIEDERGRARSFRLLLFSELPDRLHAELLSPVGSPRLILDGGAGRLAVTFVRDGESFVGAARPEVLGRILGVEIGLERLVQALLLGEVGGGELRIERAGADAPGLPEQLRVSSARGLLSLELKRLRPLQVDPSELGTGRPPDGTRVRPLRELEAEGERIEALGEAPREP